MFDRTTSTSSDSFSGSHVPDVNAMLTPEQFAAALQITHASLRVMIRRGSCPAPVHFGNRPRWSAPVIAAWIREGCTRPTTASMGPR